MDVKLINGELAGQPSLHWVVICKHPFEDFLWTVMLVRNKKEWENAEYGVALTECIWQETHPTKRAGRRAAKRILQWVREGRLPLIESLYPEEAIRPADYSGGTTGGPG